MDSLLGPALNVAGILVTAGIMWGMLKRDTTDHARRIVNSEQDIAKLKDEAARGDTMLKSTAAQVSVLQREMKDVRENWVTRAYLENALEKQTERIVNAVAERRSQPR